MTEAASDLAGLLGRVATGDRAAFRALYRATAAKLYGIILRITRRREIADEVLQEVYVRIWERAADFDPARASPITWMATIARNRALDEVRRKTVNATSDAEDEAAEVADSQPLALELVEREEDRRRLADCLGQLDDGRREMVRLAYLDGWSREELSARFGAPVATIKTWLHRSLKQLKDCLSP
jgi:RNA polymerase sigma-70 factor (ECF subfamily)